MAEFLSRRDFETFRRDVIDPMKKNMDALSTKDELNHQTMVITTRIKNFEDSVSEKAKNMKWFVGLVAPMVFAVVMMSLTMIAKALKLL